MDKNKVFSMIKEDLLQAVENLDYHTLDTDCHRIKSYLNMLESISALETLDHQERKKFPGKHEKKPNEMPIKETEKPNDVHLFERKLKGGFIQEIEAYVPETAVRQLSLEEGDWIRAVPIGKKDGKKMYYRFDLVKKGNARGGNRREMKYCVVERNGGVWMSNQTLSGENIKLGDLPFTVRIRDSEAQDFHLSEGDIVDIAYYEDNPVASKVIWKHRIENDEYTTPLPHGAYKDKSVSDGTKEAQEYPEIRGKNITLIGCIDRQAAYRDRLTALGAEFQAMDGTEDEPRISASIQRSDLVVIIIPQVSHAGSAAAKKHCKANNIPFVTVDSIGTTSVINSAANLARRLTMKIGS